MSECKEGGWEDSVETFEAIRQILVPLSIIRQFETGATRSADSDKFDYEGFLNPKVLEVFAAYMHINRTTADGSTRDSDNWQKGIPISSYVKSLWRHFHDLWSSHRGHSCAEGELAAAMGVMFNVQGWVLERMKADPEWYGRELEKYKVYRQAELKNRNTNTVVN